MSGKHTKCSNRAECAKLQPEYTKQQEIPSSHEGTAPPATEHDESAERQERLRAISSDLLYWKGGLKVLHEARLPKWRGSFKWQIEAQIEALQEAYARLRAEADKEGG